MHNLATTTHVFEAAGLGLAPFTFVGVTHSVGTKCDFCGTPIVNVYWVKSADAKQFKVGCDCIDKTHDAGLIAIADITRRRLEREKRQAREAAVRAAILVIFNSPEKMAEVAKLPHPFGWTNRVWAKDVNGEYLRNAEGDTYTVAVPLTGEDYFRYMKRNSGNAGLAKLLKWCRTNGIA